MRRNPIKSVFAFMRLFMNGINGYSYEESEIQSFASFST